MKKKMNKAPEHVEALIAQAYHKGLLQHSGDAAHANGGEEFGFWCSADQLRDFVDFIRCANNVQENS